MEQESFTENAPLVHTVFVCLLAERTYHARTNAPSPRHGLNIVICPINRSPPLQ
jgi:hypothetical protein